MSKPDRLEDYRFYWVRVWEVWDMHTERQQRVLSEWQVGRWHEGGVDGEPGHWELVHDEWIYHDVHKVVVHYPALDPPPETGEPG